MRHTLLLIIGTPHQDFVVLLHICITEHGIIGVKNIQVDIVSLLGVGIFGQVVHQLVANDLGRSHTFRQEVVDFGIDVEAIQISAVTGPSGTTRNESCALMVLQPRTLKQGHA